MFFFLVWNLFNFPGVRHFRLFGHEIAWAIHSYSTLGRHLLWLQPSTLAESTRRIEPWLCKRGTVGWLVTSGDNFHNGFEGHKFLRMSKFLKTPTFCRDSWHVSRDKKGCWCQRNQCHGAPCRLVPGVPFLPCETFQATFNSRWPPEAPGIAAIASVCPRHRGYLPFLGSCRAFQQNIRINLKVKHWVTWLLRWSMAAVQPLRSWWRTRSVTWNAPRRPLQRSVKAYSWGPWRTRRPPCWRRDTVRGHRDFDYNEA